MARAQYYQAGYTPPAGVNSATGVKEYQRMLGVDVDGIWGPKTQAAYDQYLAGQNTQTNSGNWLWGAPGSQGASSQGGTDLFNRYYQTILGQLQVPTINLNIPQRRRGAPTVAGCPPSQPGRRHLPPPVRQPVHPGGAGCRRGIQGHGEQHLCIQPERAGKRRGPR